MNSRLSTLHYIQLQFTWIYINLLPYISTSTIHLLSTLTYWIMLNEYLVEEWFELFHWFGGGLADGGGGSDIVDATEVDSDGISWKYLQQSMLPILWMKCSHPLPHFVSCLWVHWKCKIILIYLVVLSTVRSKVVWSSISVHLNPISC